MTPPDETDRSAAEVEAPASVSRIDEVPETYSRLLAEYRELLKTLDLNPFMSLAEILRKIFNPRFEQQFARDILLNTFQSSDAVGRELPCAADILKRLQALGEPQLRALARWSDLNVRKMTSHVFLGGWNKIFVAITAFVAVAKGVKEIFGLNVADYLLHSEAMFSALLGLAAGFIFNILVLLHRVRLVRALDEIISTALAARNPKL